MTTSYEILNIIIEKCFYFYETKQSIKKKLFGPIFKTLS